MTDQANPGSAPAEQGALTVAQAAEAFSGLLGAETATEETEPAQTETEQDVPDAEAEDDAPPQANAHAEGDDDTAEAAAETETEPEPDKAPRYTVKIDGQEQRVTFDELKAGYQRDSDYRRKTMKLADERKAVEAERSQVKQVLDQLIPALQSAAQDKWATVDWVQMAQNDPAGYVARRAEYEADMTRLALANQERQRAAEAEQAKRTETLRTKITEERERLLQAIPAFRDEKQAKALSASLKSFLATEGFTPDEIAGVVDHRAIKLTHKAWLYEQSQKTRVAAADRAKAPPRVLKPGGGVKEAPDTVARQKAAERLKQSGRVEDAAAWFQTLKL